MAPSKRPGRAELLPRYLYFSSLLKGRKVLEVGAVAATEGLSAHHLAKLCKEVVAVDDVAEEVAKAQRTLARPGLIFQAGGLSKLKAKSFEVVLASEIIDENTAEDLAQYVSRKGFLIAGVRMPSGPSFKGKPGPGGTRMHEKVQAVFAERFESVTVLWQSAVLGYEISPEGEQELLLDPSLAGETEPGYQLIIAGAKPPELPLGTVFHVSHEDVELGADQATFKALEQELHRVRIELVEKQAEFHTSGGVPPAAGAPDPTQILRPSAEQDRVLSTAHAQLIKAVEELKAVRESEARIRESLGNEIAQKSELKKLLEEARSSDAAARAELKRRIDEAFDHDVTGKIELKKQLEAHDAEQSARVELERQLAETKAELEREQEAAVEAQTAASAELKRLMDEATKAEADAQAALDAQLKASREEAAAERRAFEAKLVEADARAARLTAAGQELSKRRSELEETLQETKKRLGELEEELALASSMESSALAAEQARVVQLQKTVDEVGVALARAGEREEKLREELDALRAERASIDRDFTSVMRELRQALDEKEALQKQIAAENLERARAERMRKA